LKITSSLKKNHEFKRLYKRGNSISSPFAVVYCRRNGLGENRLGLTVSTKIGGAVARNRVRRRFKEIYRLYEPQLSPGHDIVIVARVKARYAKYDELNRSLRSLFKKLKLTKS